MPYPLGPYQPWMMQYPMAVNPTTQYLAMHPMMNQMIYPMNPVQTNKNRIRHIVLFSLKPGIGPEEKKKFFQDSIQMHLSIPVVENFELLCQIDPDSEYPYAFMLEFSDPDALEAFQIHPLHQKYVNEQWSTYVERYLINDLTAC